MEHIRWSAKNRTYKIAMGGLVRATHCMSVQCCRLPRCSLKQRRCLLLCVCVRSFCFVRSFVRSFVCYFGRFFSTFGFVCSVFRGAGFMFLYGFNHLELVKLFFLFCFASLMLLICTKLWVPDAVCIANLKIISSSDSPCLWQLDGNKNQAQAPSWAHGMAACVIVRQWLRACN